jgi:hypothetical protein
MMGGGNSTGEEAKKSGGGWGNKMKMGFGGSNKSQEEMGKEREGNRVVRENGFAGDTIRACVRDVWMQDIDYFFGHTGGNTFAWGEMNIRFALAKCRIVITIMVDPITRGSN